MLSHIETCVTIVSSLHTHTLDLWQLIVFDSVFRNISVLLLYFDTVVWYVALKRERAHFPPLVDSFLSASSLYASAKTGDYKKGSGERRRFSISLRHHLISFYNVK